MHSHPIKHWKNKFMKAEKYHFTSADKKFRKNIEKQYGGKISDEDFYKLIKKQKRWLKEYMEAVKKWAQEKPWEAEQLSKLVKSWEEKEKNKKLYDKVAKLKKLTVIELEKLLTPVLEKEGYIKLEFSQLDLQKDVIISFTIQDTKTGQHEYDSRMKLKKVIEKTLVNTNWRLMSEGIHYRLGILTGQLRGREREEDLAKLIGTK